MEFNRPTLAALVARIETDIVSRLEIVSVVLRRALVRIISRAVAGAAHLLHGHLDWSKRQLFATTADEGDLAIHGSELGVTRTAAGYAAGDLTADGANTTPIPEGSRWRRDDGVVFVSTADTTIVSGSATVPLKAEVAGENSNTDAGVALTLVQPIAGVNSTGTVASGGLAGGFDVQDVEAWRAAILDRKRNPPHGGAIADYKKWAFEVSGITRVWVYPNYMGPGTVGVTFVCDGQSGSIIPSSETVAQVQVKFDDEENKPACADADAFAPVAAPIAYNIHLVPDTQDIRDAVISQLDDLHYVDGKPGSTFYISRIRGAIASAPGLVDHTLVAPSADVTHTPSQLPTRGTTTFS